MPVLQPVTAPNGRLLAILTTALLQATDCPSSAYDRVLVNQPISDHPNSILEFMEPLSWVPWEKTKMRRDMSKVYWGGNGLRGHTCEKVRKEDQAKREIDTRKLQEPQLICGDLEAGVALVLVLLQGKETRSLHPCTDQSLTWAVSWRACADGGRQVDTAVFTMAYGWPLARVKGWLQLRSQLGRQCLAEFLGVFVLMLLTQGAVAQAVTSGESKGNFFTMFLAGSLAVTVAIYVSGNVSGAHLNPAFSLAMCLLGRLPWAKLPIYCLVQLLSAFCASGATYAVYYDALQNYTGGNLTVTGPKETASIFATYPAPYLSLNNGFLDQVLGTGILIVGILAITDTRNKGVPAGLEPVAVGLLILAIGLSLGVNCGFPLNPARDLGPRLFTYVAGWGPEVFSAGNGWWWVPVVAPLVGATLGTATYQLLVALHHPEESEPAQDLELARRKASGLETSAPARRPPL
ncbi:aquaporin-10 isoform X1 [Mustela lutreola]|uniref:aquaporin-10 isoform X1 n=2 Tax=Mustela lutreola TaxID=9666 RepID=UPI0027974BF1|nr:aquaporin-10 isoform X1 [Mustela lutreola]